MMILSAGLAYQDFKHRSINIWVLVAFGISSFAVFAGSKNIFWIDLLLNTGYLMVFFLLSLLAMKFILRKDWGQSIGSGDIIYIFLLAPLFSFEDFVFWMVILMIFSLLTHLIFKGLKIVSDEYIPLVGYMATLLVGVTIRSLF